MTLFLASLGNPSPYHLTRHSAGHVLLRVLQQRLSAVSSNHAQAHALHPGHGTPDQYHTQTASLPDSPYYLPTSHAPIALYASSSLMNVSGKNVTRHFTTWLKRAGLQSHYTHSSRQSQPPRLRLILLQDELEAPPGKLKIRCGGAELSPRGHNGVKSVVKELVRNELLAPVTPQGQAQSHAQTLPPVLTRIGIGIGRPESRRPNDVASYVLSKMSKEELDIIAGLADGVIDYLEKEVQGMAKV
ncbi:aminoacyl-tRNA hydrolase [Ascosphaera atra]|nr:aminoacyl-tRNA hydrolase [Ascosphaera atra]